MKIPQSSPRKRLLLETRVKSWPASSFLTLKGLENLEKKLPIFCGLRQSTAPKRPPEHHHPKVRVRESTMSQCCQVIPNQSRCARSHLRWLTLVLVNRLLSSNHLVIRYRACPFGLRNSINPPHLRRPHTRVQLPVPQYLQLAGLLQVQARTK